MASVNQEQEQQQSGGLSNDNLTPFSSGLSLDTSALHQPKGSQRFALNMVNDHTVARNQKQPSYSTSKTNEGSNELYINLTPGYIPIGKVYTEDNDTVIFSVAEDDSCSEIGIMTDYGKYEVIVNTPVLNFRVAKQIQATYRLRRGCERTIYWTDDYNPPRQLNIDKVDNYKDENNKFAAKKFNLIKEHSSVPEFRNIEIVEGAGSLNPGSYTISIQYVDENYNATNWLNSTDSVIIYNASLADSYHDIGGSFFSYTAMYDGDNPLSMGATSKAIQVEVGNLDETYPFYRLGFSIADSGSGYATRAVVTDVLSIQSRVYTFSSITNTTEIPIESFIFEKANIHKAKTIEQHENLLLLGNTQGWQGDICRFQKYASKIQADCIVREAPATVITPSTIKSPVLNVSDIMGETGCGYMPGEVYSFGIVYVLKSGFVTPVFHIPGRSPVVTDNVTYTQDEFPDGENVRSVFPMSKNNQTEVEYPSMGLCKNFSYWGVDGEGNNLERNKVRHHRFPDRKEIGKPLVKIGKTEDPVGFVSTTITFEDKGFIEADKRKYFFQDEETYPYTIEFNYTYHSDKDQTIREGSYSTSGESFFYLKPELEDTDDGKKPLEGYEKTALVYIPKVKGGELFVDSMSVTYKVKDTSEGAEPDSWVDITEDCTENTIVAATVGDEEVSNVVTGMPNHTITKLGIRFSNIEFPTTEELGLEEDGDEVIGYYIVRNKRDESNKTIYDTGVMTPCIQASSKERVIGYAQYIASGLLMPELKEEEDSTIGERKGTGEIHNRFWNLIMPRSKFYNSKITKGLYTIEQQGYFRRVEDQRTLTKTDRNFSEPLGLRNFCSRTRYSDVLEGSSYALQSAANPGYFSKENLDDGERAKSPHDKGLDGWCFKMAVRDNIMEFMPEDNGFVIKPEDQLKIHTLQGLEYETTEKNSTEVIYNIQSDHINQIIELEEENPNLNYYTRVGSTPLGKDMMESRLPYVVIKRTDLKNVYANFTTLPYYKETTNMIPVSKTTCTVFNGDSYVASLRYNSTTKYSHRPAYLLEKTPPSKFVAVLVFLAAAVVGALAVIFTAGLGTPLVIAGIGSCLSIVGGGLWASMEIFKDHKWIQNYQAAWEDGLNKVVSDNYTRQEFEPGQAWMNLHKEFHEGPSDDQLEYVTDCLTDLWFDTEINMGLRAKGQSDKSFLGTPGKIETGLNSRERIEILFDKEKSRESRNQRNNYIITRNSNDKSNRAGSYRKPISVLENFANNKCLQPNLERNDQREFIGTAMGEAYIINPDLQRRGGMTTYFHLSPTYDCCSDCTEDFPHRFHWSEQSFQEELIDNYSMFKENNYKDLDGETGEIVNIFKIREQLFVHTKEALWAIPKNHQERVTDEIVSFIGTGSLYEIPPRKIIEGGNGMSAGLWHRESALLCEAGYFFVCEKQGKIFQFDGKQLVAISDEGLSNWFIDNMELMLSADYKARANGDGTCEDCGKNNKRYYPYDDNPSNKFGCGFISTYDSSEGRVIFTKKDAKFGDEILREGDFELCVKNGVMTISRNHNQTVKEIEDAEIPEEEWSEYMGEVVYPFTKWRYLGIEDCKLKFERDILKGEAPVFKDVDYLIFSYYFEQKDGRDLDTRTRLFINGIKVAGPLGYCSHAAVDGQIVNENYLQHGGDNTSYGVESVLINVKNIRNDFPGLENFSLRTQAWWYTRRDDGFMHMKAFAYKGGTMVADSYTKSFINEGGVEMGVFDFPKRNLPEAPDHSDACEEATPERSPHDTGVFIYDMLTGTLYDSTSNPELPGLPGFKRYILSDFLYLEGEEVADETQYDNSWTVSYDLATRSWTSWHSYLPSMYFFVANKFYSWKYGSRGIWKHNVVGNYQNFYGKRYPFIVDYISISSPLQTRIFDGIQLICDAERYDEIKKEFVDVTTAFFNKMVAYNSRQCTGELEIKVKDEDLTEWYLEEQVDGQNNNVIIADKNERVWSLNNLRDIRIDYNQPIFSSNIEDKKENYYIDKVLNTSSMDFEKSWMEMESLRDKYLEIRLIFDKLDNIKLSLNFSSENEKISVR